MVQNSDTYISQLMRIGDISGMFYIHPKGRSKRIVIYGMGAPLPPDNGCLPDASVILGFDTDLYVPDYIGYGRSEGIFTPMHCIQTFLSLYDQLKKGCVGSCQYLGIRKRLQYDDVHFIGRSFGGAYVTLLPRFNKDITNICAIFPIVDWSNIGKSGVPEESVEGFFYWKTYERCIKTIN